MHSLYFSDAVSFSVTFGVVPGYGHDNKLEGSALDLVASVWKFAMEEEFSRSEIAVAAVLTPSLTVYPREFGCPESGEVTVTVTGAKHPNSRTSNDLWESAVIRVVEVVTKQLKQTTSLLIFSNGEGGVYNSNKPVI